MSLPTVLNRLSLEQRVRMWRVPLALLGILLVAAALRFSGLRWGMGLNAYPHPDERYLGKAMWRINLPAPGRWHTLLDPATSPLHLRRVDPETGQPYVFEWGTLPAIVPRLIVLTLVRLGCADLGSYEGHLLVGRVWNVVLALATIALAYALGALLYGQVAGLFAAAFLAFSAIHVQISHYMVADIPLTLFVLLGVYAGARLVRSGRRRDALLLGASLGGALACKIVGVTLMPLVAAALFLWLWQVRQQRGSWQGMTGITLRLLLWIGLGFLLLFGVFEFYTLLDPRPYLAAAAGPLGMRNGSTDWPITWQFVNTPAYLYQLGELIPWGLGWSLGIAVLIALPWAIGQAFIFWRKGMLRRAMPCFRGAEASGVVVLLSWLLPYALYMGPMEVRFYRYLLPLVPLLCILAGGLLAALVARLKQLRCFRGAEASGIRLAQVGLVALLIVPTLLWALAWVRIYQRPHTWLEASRWVYDHVPQQAVLSVENWNHDLPVDLPGRTLTRSYYQPKVVLDLFTDVPPETRFQQIVGVLRQGDYILLSTPRVYNAVRRLPWRFPVEIRYYELLFREALGFRLAHVFTSYPGLGRWTLVDDNADESISIYDHPKVLIYQKVRDLPEAELRSLFAEALRAQPVVARRGSTPPVPLPVPDTAARVFLSGQNR